MKWRRQCLWREGSWKTAPNVLECKWLSKIFCRISFLWNKFQNKLSNWEQIVWNWQQLEGLADPYNGSQIAQKPLFCLKALIPLYCLPSFRIIMVALNKDKNVVVPYCPLPHSPQNIVFECGKDFFPITYQQTGYWWFVCCSYNSWTVRTNVILLGVQFLSCGKLQKVFFGTLPYLNDNVSAFAWGIREAYFCSHIRELS